MELRREKVVDAESALVHRAVANIADVCQVDRLLLGDESLACGDAGKQKRQGYREFNSGLMTKELCIASFLR